MRNDLVNLRHRSFPVLVVEDNKDHQLIIQYSLLTSMPQAKAVFASTAKEALAYLQLAANKRLALPRLLLLDICLPHASIGWQLLKDIRQQWPCLPVIILTGVQDEEVIKQAYELGANAFMVKPLDLDSWERSFRILNAYWATVVTLPPR